jgi:cytochrome c551/c552
MAATDKNYRSQYALDIVFALTSLAMLLSTVWMFMDDYFRPFKTEQRSFREVEAAVAQRMAIAQIPGEVEFNGKQKAFADALDAYEKHRDELSSLKRDVEGLQPQKERAEAAFQAVNADVGSILSFYNIAREKGDDKAAENAAKKYREQLVDLNQQLAKAQATRDDIVQQMKSKQAQIDGIEKSLTSAQSEWKKITDKFDTQVRAAYRKQWGMGDMIRAMPIIDGFASPYKIHQITNNDIPIDYNFKLVTRFDRCQTCHLGIDRPAYTKEFLRSLTQEPTKEQEARLAEAHRLLNKRLEEYDKLPAHAPGASDISRLPRSSEITLARVDPNVLNESRINEFAAHPRLDLFVGANSKHPAERFGCSACHSGQGSATDFTLAAHSPNGVHQKHEWEKEHGWEHQHMWDFPMLPQRFVESSCIKCHHEVTDLISSDNRVEAPKLIRGYNLIKDNGCFGCHEIAGLKRGQEIGPDLRLEPNPPLEDLTPLERARLESDPENPPGNLRKVGPSLYRLKEKTNLEWTAKWISAPRGFRPDTKMPHFYGNSNNSETALKEQAPDQVKFPNTEIRAAAYYLFQASDQYVKDIATQHAKDKQSPQDRATDDARLEELLAKGKDKLNDAEKKELDAVRLRSRLRREKELTDLAPKHAGDPAEGRRLFTERGCLACHTHEGTATPQGSKGAKDYVPAVESAALYGPNLSQVVAKLGQTPGDKKSARTWLVQWIMDPHVHSPRSRMPVTHLTPEQAADIAAWLLSQAPKDLGEGWNELSIPAADTKDLQELARVYLVRLLPKSDIATLFESNKLPPEIVKDLPQEEKALAENLIAGNDVNTTYRYYVGKKAVGRLGCYACHDIPGFENSKPIGTTLNDWGKKPADRLAFENIKTFLEHHFYRVPSWSEGGKLPGPKVVKVDGKEVEQKPYEAFFYDDLEHEEGRTRVGYLHQKLLDPRSFDYGKILPWDDRSRMPQFRFARARKRTGESDADFVARAWKDEADAREAVMTFILGLTAEQIPTRMTNQPRGDRLMEVKGRQVIDKFNCAGCHLIRPGAYDFQVSPGSLEQLEAAHKLSTRSAETSGMHTFLQDHFWTGRTPTQLDRLIAPGVKARLTKDEDDPEAPPTVQLTLAEALRFIRTDAKTQEKIPVDIPAFSTIFIPLKDLTPAHKSIKTQEDLDRFLASVHPLGGTFADLMVPYLNKKDASVYKMSADGKDSAEARASLPPSLIGEGARTQPQWLYQFLLDPTQVRRMSILRMPKFNLSREEAKQLVDYFAGVERITNPGIGLTYPGDHIPQQAPLDDPFWVQKNSEYLQRLKTSGPGKDTTWYDERMKSYKEPWSQSAALAQVALQQEIKRAEQQKKETEEKISELKTKAEKLSDAKEKAAVQKQIGDLETVATVASDELKSLQAKVKETDADLFKQAWNRDQAYVSDAYRLIANKAMCLQCHQVAGFKSSNPTTQGPPLALVNERLRPDWVLRWIATPQRHLTYESLMPVNFPKVKPGEKLQFQDVLVGQPLEQVEAIRDALMNYPRVVNLPVNQQWNPNLQAAPPADKK